uniref:Protein kinase domain-containing protein n=1 Tax=Globodera pallida TaxID=36090 RepID=A0A183C5E7_GLOPA
MYFSRTLGPSPVYPSLKQSSVPKCAPLFIHAGRTFLRCPFRANLGHCANMLSSCYPDGLPEPALCLIVKATLKALEHLHAVGIIHRSVCAENIWLDSDGQIRLALTRHAIRIADCPKWIGVEDRVQEFTSGLWEMVAWLAPEVLMQDLNGYGADSDLYSVGICLCELGNGVVPFQEMEPLRILYEKLSGSAPVLLDSTTHCGPDSFGESRTFSTELHDFVGEVLEQSRPTASELLQKYEKSLFCTGPSICLGKALTDHLSLAKPLF